MDECGITERYLEWESWFVHETEDDDEVDFWAHFAATMDAVFEVEALAAVIVAARTSAEFDQAVHAIYNAIEDFPYKVDITEVIDDEPEVPQA
jgi:hypothetical protein